MRRIYTIMGLACLLLCVLAWNRGGLEQLLQGAYLGLLMLLKLLPLLLLAFASAGLISAVSSEKEVSRWLGSESGLKGILLGGLAGALVPGGPFIFFPLAATLLVSGAGLGTVISFVTAKNLWTLTRLPLEIALLGPELTGLRYALTFAFPVLAGLAAHYFLQGQTEKLKLEIRRLQHLRDPGQKSR
ncbi:MAG: permease [Desulfohalobiaceae bacterium]